MVKRLSRRLVGSFHIAFIALWLAAVGAWIILGSGPSGIWQEIASYSLVIPILLASFFFGRRGGLLTALVSSAISGALALRQPAPLESLAGQRILFQILVFNILGLVTSGLAERTQEAQASYKALFDGVPVGLFRIARAGRIIDANATLAVMLGYADRDALLAANLNAADIHVNVEDRATVQAMSERAGGMADLLVPLQRRDGSRLWVLESGQAVRDRSGQIAYYGGSVQDITDRQRAAEAEHDQITLTEALRDTADALNSTLNFDEVLERILANVNHVVPGDTANIMLCEGSVARVVRRRGYGALRPEAALPAHDLVVSEVANLCQMAATRQPLIVSDVETDPGWQDFATTRWIRSYAGAPICVKGQVIGFINLDSAIPGFFTARYAGPLQAFADQAAIALENARLLAEAERRAEQLKLLYDAGLALNNLREPRSLLEFLFRSALRVVQADRAEFFQFRPATNSLRLELAFGYAETTPTTLNDYDFRADSDTRVNGWVAVHRRPMSLPDLTASPLYVVIDPALRSGLWVPVEHEHRLLGILAVLSLRPQAFTAQDEQLLTLFASQAAVALENVRLFAETRRRLEELEAVNKLSVTLRSAQSLDEMAAGLLEQSLAQWQAGDGAVWLYDRPRHQLIAAAQRGWLAESETELNAVGEIIAAPVFDSGGPFSAVEFVEDPQLAALPALPLPAGWGGTAVPIRAAQDVIGVLCVSVQLPRALTADDLPLLNALAEIAGNAMHRATLYAQTEQRLQRLAALREIDSAISTSVDLRLTLDVLLDQVTSQLRVDAADVLVLDAATQVLRYATGRGFLGFQAATARLRLGEGLAGRCALERRRLSALSAADILQAAGRAARLSGERFQAYFAAPLIAKGQVKGVLEIFHRSALQPDAEWLDFLETLGRQAAIAIDNTTLFDQLQRSNTELMLAYDATLEGWSHALDLRDKEPEGHAQRVAETAMELARRMGIGEADLIHVRRGALLHDIGQMGVPDNILRKPGPLTAEERTVMCQHPEYAYEMLAPIVFLRPALDIPYCHHEMWDGTGYPRGLRGEQIPLAARVFAVVDVWDALNSDRPYRAAWPRDRVRAYLRERAGAHFDPQVVAAFLELAL
jgi:PAS domain S-box-containing protein/putative nucleotidyltransferase with HDIG domain